MRHRQRNTSPLQRLVLFSIAVLALAGGYYWGNLHAPKNIEMLAASLLEDPIVLQPIALRDQFGEPFDNQRLAEHWNLVLFGYTRSRNTSPAMLTLSTQILNRMADRPELQKNMRVLFVTVDPEHDTPEVMGTFLMFYRDDFVGLTAKPASIRAFAGQLGVRFQRQPADKEDDYRIDHSTSMALVDFHGRLFGLFTGKVDAASIAHDLKLIMDKYD